MIIDDLVKKGYFKEFSNEHFIMKAINGDANIPKNITDAIFQYCYDKGNRVYLDEQALLFAFAARINRMFECFGERDIKNFLAAQLSAGKKNYDEKQFFRATSEIECLNYVLNIVPDSMHVLAEYEPQFNGKKNPEARIKSLPLLREYYIYDIEVKTAGFEDIKEYMKEGTKYFKLNIPLKESNLEKIKKIVSQKGMVFEPLRVMKIRDFINSAGKKFVIPTNHKHSNILFINWTFCDIRESGLMEPFACLYDDSTGILKTDKYHKELGITTDALEKISAIVVYKDNIDSFSQFNLLTAVQIGNCKIMYNDRFCKVVDKEKIEKELRIPEVTVKDMKPAEFFCNYKYCEDDEEILKVWKEILKDEML